MIHHLLPQPKALSQRDGAFTLDAHTAIALPATAGEDAFFAAQQLQDELRQAAHARPAIPILKAFAPPRSENVVLLVQGPEQAQAFGVDPTPPPIPGGTAHAERISIQAVAAQAYTLSVTPAAIALYAETATGLFYAAQTLRQLVRLHGSTIPALVVHDWPTLPYRGLMLDISRRKVPTLATLKELVIQLSHYKLNVLQLYTEHTFQFPRHPQIGAGCGSLNSQDIVELDAIARAHHVELMPNLQSFGHFHNTLQLPAYRHLAESDMLWTLSPAYEESYRLLDELYGDMLTAFTSTTLNVDCDETYDLGKGATKDRVGEIGLGRVYLDHILRVRELAARYGRRIQVWGDILLNHPELIGEVPDDVTLLDWHYDPAEAYPTAEIFAQAGRRFWVCPGVGSWNSLFPRLYGANANIRNFVRDGAAAGAEGMLNTDWGDFGHYQPLGLSWYGYVFGAAQGWTGGETDDADFEAAFAPLFFGPDGARVLEAIHQLADTNDLPGVHRPNVSLTVLALFDDPLVGETVTALPQETLAEMQALAGRALAILDDVLRPGHPHELTLREMVLTARLTEYAARKVALSQEIRRDLQDPALDGDQLYRHALALKGLAAELEALRADFESLWLARARRSEIHVALGYYGSLRARYQAAVRWLRTQHQALLERKAVDAEMETYDASGHRVLWYTWPDEG